MSKPAKQRGVPGTQVSFEVAIANTDVNRVRKLLAAGHKPDAAAIEQAVDACILASTIARRKEKPLFGQLPSMKEREKAAAAAEAYFEIARILIDGGAAAPELLCSAARCGHTKLARLLIRAGADVDYQPPMGTPLENAVSAGNAEIVQALIKAGADLQHQGVGGTLLTRAVDAGEIEVAKELIASGIDVNAVPRFCASALLTAVTERKADFVRLLLDSGANVNQKGSVVCGEFGKPEVKEDGPFRTTRVPNPPVARDATPLIVATRRGYAEIVALLTAADANVNATDSEGFSAIVYAMQANAEPLIKLLKDAGARPPKYAEGSLEAAWIAAAKAGDCARLRELIANGVDVNVKYASKEQNDDKERDGKGTALKYAAQKGHLDAVKLLLASGATVDEKFGGRFRSTDETALMHAARAGHLEVARALLAAGAATSAKDRNGKTVLHYAAEGGHTAMIALLTKRGANLETKTRSGTSTLMEAANAGHAPMITALIKAGADPNRFTNGITALWHAASGGHVAAVQALLDGGADPKAGEEMRSPLKAASSRGHKDVVNLLLNRGNDRTKRSSAKKVEKTYYGAALVNAALMGQIEIVRTLLESGADPNVPDERHFTALMAAVRTGSIELMQMLLKAGADANALNDDGETALDLAYENIRTAKDQARFLTVVGRADVDTETREAIRVIKSAGKEDAATKLLKEAGGKRAKELRGKTTPIR